MHDEDYLIVDPACEVNERGTRDKNDGNEVVNNCYLPLDLELTERVEVDDETTLYTEEDWAVQNKLKLIKEYNLTFPSPWKHARAKEKKQEEAQPVWRGFCHRQDSFERRDGLASGTGRSIGATRDRPGQRHRTGLDRQLL